jgi:hypothetical protein
LVSNAGKYCHSGLCQCTGLRGQVLQLALLVAVTASTPFSHGSCRDQVAEHADEQQDAGQCNRVLNSLSPHIGMASYVLRELVEQQHLKVVQSGGWLVPYRLRCSTASLKHATASFHSCNGWWQMAHVKEHPVLVPLLVLEPDSLGRIVPVLVPLLVLDPDSLGLIVDGQRFSLLGFAGTGTNAYTTLWSL